MRDDEQVGSMKHLVSIIALTVGLVCASLPAYAQTPISGLPAAAAVAPTDIVPIVHSGTTSKATFTQIWSPTGPTIWTGAGSLGTGAQTFCAQDGGAVAGIVCNVPSSSTNGFTWTVNNGPSILQVLPASILTSLPLTIAAPVILNGAGTLGTSSQTYIAQDAGATKGTIFNVPSSSTNGFQWTFGAGSPTMQLLPTSLKLTIPATTTSYLGTGSYTGTPAAGDQIAAESATCGKQMLATTSDYLDYGCTTSGAFTLTGGNLTLAGSNSFRTGSSIYGATGSTVAGQTTYSGAGSGITGPGSGQTFDDDNAGGGWNLSWATGSSYGIRFWKGVPGSSEIASIGPASSFYVSSVAGASLAPVGPMYTFTSGVPSSTAHLVYGTCVTSATNACSVTLSGTGAPFQNGSTWACFGSAVATVVGVFVYISGGGTSAVAEYNDAANRTAQINIGCIGY